jgi:hypothetical protein
MTRELKLFHDTIRKRQRENRGREKHRERQTHMESFQREKKEDKKNGK